MSEALKIAIIGGAISLCTAIIPKLLDHYFGLGKDIKEIKTDVNELKRHDRANGDMIYQVLDHLATNNNTGGMKKALNSYNEFYRHED